MGKKPRRRRSFTPEFKAEIVELCQRGDRSVGQVARDFDLTETAVREWVKQAERDAGTRHDGGLASEERRELDEPQRRELVPMLARRTRAMYHFLARQARTGVQPWTGMWDTGHGDAWQADADYIHANEAAWAAALLG